MPSNTLQQALGATFAARDDFFAHRSSAIFPLRLSAHSDFHLVFMNYWNIKNEVSDVGVILRLYTEDGALAARMQLPVRVSNHLSIKEILFEARNMALPFEGLIEVEIVSTENLRFAFPAVLGVYESNGYFSSVHSAGRVRNPDELKRRAETEESNWTCKFSNCGRPDAVTPFFHYFVGPTPLHSDETITVSLRNRDGTVADQRSVAVGQLRPFSSRLFLVDELFGLTRPPMDGSFVSVRLFASDTFPRLVVGNLHRDLDFLEVTHSFPITQIEDYCPEPSGDGGTRSCRSLLTAQRTLDLSLDVRIFPTNSAGEIEASLECKQFNDKELKPTGDEFTFASAVGDEGYSFTMKGDDEMYALRLSGRTVPSRINASFRYTVANSSGRFSTDIATGAKSSVYPPKGRHWGHGCIGDGYETVVMFHNNSHQAEHHLPNRGSLRLIVEDVDTVIPVSAESESCVALKLSDYLCQELRQSAAPKFLSWYLVMDQPIGACFWVSYRADGAIFGEHGF